MARLVPILAFGLLTAAPVQAQSHPPVRVSGNTALRMRASLRGLRGFTVLVSHIPPDIEAAGLTRAALQSAVASTLKKAGVPLYPMPNGNAHATAPPPNVASLLVNVTVQKVGSGSKDYAVLVVTEVDQDVTTGAGARIIRLPTWRKPDFGVLGRDKLPRVVARAQDAAATLAVDFKAANGK